MAVELMANPLSKIRKIRSLEEAITRGGQAIHAYREERSGGARIPTDHEFKRVIDRSYFGGAPVIAETIWHKFFTNGKERFFRSFKQQDESLDVFRERFGDRSSSRFIAAAENILDGRIDLMGLKSLYKIGRAHV